MPKAFLFFSPRFEPWAKEQSPKYSQNPKRNGILHQKSR